MAIFYWTENSSKYVSGDPGHEGETVSVAELRGHICDVDLGKKVRIADNGSTVYETQCDVANGSRRAAIRSIALRIAKKHAFGEDDDELGNVARDAFDKAADPKLTVEQATRIIE